MDKINCSICGEEILELYSNNAWPVNDGRCCGECNGLHVIPARLDRFYGKKVTPTEVTQD